MAVFDFADKAGNMLLNTHPDPLPVYKFKVYIQNIEMGFTKVTSIEDSIDTDPLQEGGVNDRVYSLAKPVTAERTLVLERGFTFRGIGMALLTYRLAVGQRMTSDIVITVNKQDGSVGNIFLIHGATLKRLSYSDLDAASSGSLIETMEFSYEKMEQYPIQGFVGGLAMGLL